jgi:hypothetical protein
VILHLINFSEEENNLLKNPHDKRENSATKQEQNTNIPFLKNGIIWCTIYKTISTYEYCFQASVSMIYRQKAAVLCVPNQMEMGRSVLIQLAEKQKPNRFILCAWNFFWNSR